MGIKRPCSPICLHRYHRDFLSSSFLCKYQLELVSSGGHCLLDFLMGEDQLSYFREVQYGLQHMWPHVHGTWECTSRGFGDHPTKPNISFLYPVHGAGECNVSAAVLVDCREFSHLHVVTGQTLWYWSWHSRCYYYIWQVLAPPDHLHRVPSDCISGVN